MRETTAVELIRTEVMSNGVVEKIRRAVVAELVVATWSQVEAADHLSAFDFTGGEIREAIEAAYLAVGNAVGSHARDLLGCV